MNLESMPSQFWGLDPVFRSHAKLYIKDVNNLKKIEGYPGIFQYGCHTVVRVDIQGILVRVENKARFFVYTLDDGTGVINCTCWKNEKSNHCTKQIQGLPEVLTSKLLTIHDQEEKSSECHLLGDMLHVRGKLRMFRDEIEVTSGYCAKVTDPNMETARMLHLPSLYKECYDKAVQLPKAIAQGIGDGQLQQIYLICEAESAILVLTNENNWSEFSKTQLLHSVAIKNILDKSNQPQVLDDALRSLTKGGHIFQIPSKPQDTYTVTSMCTELDQEVIHIIKRWTDTKDGDEDCPASHIFNQLHKQEAYSTLELSAVHQCLDKLEGQSDIISTAEKRFILFSNT